MTPAIDGAVFRCWGQRRLTRNEHRVVFRRLWVTSEAVSVRRTFSRHRQVLPLADIDVVVDAQTFVLGLRRQQVIWFMRRGRPHTRPLLGFEPRPGSVEPLIDALVAVGLTVRDECPPYFDTMPHIFDW